MVVPNSLPQTAETAYVLPQVPWAAYLLLSDHLQGGGLRLTFDRGALEIMTVSREHERPKGLLARLVAALTEELGLEIETGGNMTFRLEAEQRGMEADEVFWIQHQPQVRGRDSFDPETDPPPDLALEIEITNPIGRRLEIYAALRIPEIWRCDGQVVVIHLLGPDQQYAEAERSRAFPLVAAADLTRFVGLRGTMGMNAIIQEFRTWIRAQGAARP